MLSTSVIEHDAVAARWGEGDGDLPRISPAEAVLDGYAPCLAEPGKCPVKLSEALQRGW